MNLISNQFELLYILSVGGNINFNSNILQTDKSSVSFIGPMSFNITNNIFVEKIRAKFAGQNYLNMEKNVDKTIPDFLDLSDNIIDAANFIIRGNKHKLSYH